MAYYRLGKVIEMRRTALGYGRDAFDVQGPAGMTIYRIETGKSKPTEQTYRGLTRSMGVEESTGQGILKTSSMEILNLVNDISAAFRARDYERAERLLEQIERGIDVTVPRNRQYIGWQRAKLKYEQGLISAKEYEAVIREALSYTIPGFEEAPLRNWPFHQEEWQMLLALNNMLKAQKRYEEQRELLEVRKTVLDMNYLDSECKIRYRIATMINLADVLGNIAKHEEAIQADRAAILLCEEYQEFAMLHYPYYDIHWNYYELGKKRALSAWEEAECRQCLLKAYYINEAQDKRKELYGKCLKERYPEVLQ